MLSAITGGAAKLGGALMGFLTSLVNNAIKWAGVFFAYRLGKKKVEAEINEKNAEIKDAQLEIAARPTRHRDSILERMRRRRRSDD